MAAKGSREGRMNRRSTGDVQGSETTLCDTVPEDTRHCVFVQIQRMDDPQVNPDVNYRF